MANTLKFSLILHGVDTDDLNIVANECYFLEEQLIFDRDLPRNHWELAIGNEHKTFLISTCAENGLEVHNACLENGCVRYFYNDARDYTEHFANILSYSKIEPIKIKDLINVMLERIKKHPYRLFYDNCHNNALYGYMQFGVPNNDLVDIVNKKYGIKLLK